MQNGVDKYLDGEVPRADLTLEEQAELDLVERVRDEARAFIAERQPPDLAAAVMSRVDRLEPLAATASAHAIRRLLAVIWTPREISIRVRPAYALIAAAAIGLVAVLSPSRVPTTSPSGPAADATAERQVLVQFRLEAVSASSVRLAGSFTGWQPSYELHEAAPGLWTITVPLPAGVHDYVFVVDGTRWVSDPYAQHVDDGFGGRNSRLALIAPDGPRS